MSGEFSREDSMPFYEKGHEKSKSIKSEYIFRQERESKEENFYEILRDKGYDVFNINIPALRNGKFEWKVNMNGVINDEDAKILKSAGYVFYMNRL